MIRKEGEPMLNNAWMARPLATIVACMFLFPLLASVLPGPGALVSAGPPANGDWNISDAQSVSNSDVTLTGNLTVNLGGSLTLDHVNLRMNCSAKHIYNITIKAGGKLTVKNSTIAPIDFLQRYRYNFIIAFGATADIFDSTLAAIGEGNLTKIQTLGLYVEAAKVRLLGNTFTRTNILYTATGILVVGPLASPLIEGNDISGLYAVGISFVGSQGTVRNNTIRNNAIGLMSLLSQPVLDGNAFTSNLMGVQVTQSSVAFNGNTFRGSLFGAFGAESSDVTMESDRFIDNAGDMTFNQSGLVAKRLTMSGAVNGIDIDHAGSKEVLIENSSLKASTTELVVNDSSVRLLNTTFDQAKVQITTDTGSLQVFWFLHVNVSLASGPAASGAMVSVKDTQNTTVFQGPTGSDGMLRWVQVEQYSQTGSKRTNMTPHEVRASMGPLWSNATADMLSSRTVNIVMDDMPPVVRILQPKEDALLNQSSVAFRGNATDNDGVSLVEYKVSSGPWTGADGLDPWNFTVAMQDGTHQVSVRATDITGLQTTALVNVTVDTVSPMLIISKPANDTLTNKTQVQVEGRTEPGASLHLVPAGGGENVSLPVDAQGRFQFPHNLTEGPNNIVLVAQDAAGNRVMRSVRVVLDTLPPRLSLSSPVPDLITNSSKVIVAGNTDGGGMAAITVNGLPISVAASGNFSQELLLSDGTYTIRVIAKDLAGNQATLMRTVTVDTVRPKVEIDAPDDGLVTNITLISVKGRAQAKLVWVGVVEADTSPDPEAGWWDYNELYPLKEGQNNITVQAQDVAGNRGSLTVKVIRDTVPPVINITEPLDGSKTTALLVNVVGTTEAGARITVNGDLLDETDGSFSVPVNLLLGKNVITVTAKDAAGNEARTTLTITREKKTVGPTSLGGDNLWPLLLIIVLMCIAVFLLAYNYARGEEPKEERLEKKGTRPKAGKKGKAAAYAKVDEEE